MAAVNHAGEPHVLAQQWISLKLPHQGAMNRGGRTYIKGVGAKECEPAALTTTHVMSMSCC